MSPDQPGSLESAAPQGNGWSLRPQGFGSGAFFKALSHPVQQGFKKEMKKMTTTLPLLLDIKVRSSLGTYTTNAYMTRKAKANTQELPL